MFEMKIYRSINGLILRADGNNKGPFKRCGTFKIGMADDFAHQQAFWKGCERFDVAGLEVTNSDGVNVPEVEAETGKIVYRMQRQRQYIISVQ